MTDKQIKEEIKHINTRNQEYIAENNRMKNKQIMIDGLSCDNCPDAQRCQEQQTKKEYAINQVLQDIPSEYANVISRLKQIIPSITRCDYVLEKQLKRKEQECEELKKINITSGNETWKTMSITFNNGTVKTEVADMSMAEYSQLKLENTKYKQTLTEIKEIAKNFCNACKEFEPNKCNEINLRYCNYNKIIQKCEEVNK